ncbi:MAG: amino acid ABC transporter substrate-binding protein [Streptosporangiales bacterium]|nr:amino acid ABC transporter substrate-binding protein [Streptosporangiales bacterium]MBO0890285.1 amino acid ABC transporter substrate-binding protein [Acidothermales bacterium]
MSRMHEWRFKAVAVGVVAVVALAGCAQSTKPQGKASNGVTLVKKGVLTACTHLPYEPFQFTQNGKIVGFEVDLGDLIAKDLGVKQKVIDTPWEGIVTGEDFNSGQCDIAYGGATITDERAKVVDFSKPYVDVKQAVLVKKDSGIDGLDKLRGKKLGAQSDTTGKIYASKHAKQYGYTIVDFEDYGLLTTAVRTGQVTASIADSGVLQYYVKQHPDTKIGAMYETGEQLGFMSKKGDNPMHDEVDKVLDKAKQDGTFDTLYKKWFGVAPVKN